MKYFKYILGIALSVFLVAGMAKAVTVLYPGGGGTGTSQVPTYGKVLVGQSNGTYLPTATSSLNITTSATGNWTGIFDGQEGTYYLSRINHTGTQGVATLSNYDLSFASNYGTNNLISSTTMPWWAQGGLNASSTSHFVYASTTALTISGNSYLGTVSSGVWNGTTIGDTYLTKTGDWTGTIDSNNFAGGAIGAGELIYGGSAGSFSELALGTNGYVLGISNAVPAWVATTSIPVAGDVTGTLSATVVGNDSHDHTSATISGIDISADTNLAVTAPVTLTGDTLSLGNVTMYPAFTHATSSAWTGTTTILLAPAYVAETWNGVKCFTDAGTLNVVFSDGTNLMDLLNASTTVGTFTLSTNNTFTASEKRYVDIGTPISSPQKISCSISKTLSIN